DRDQAGRAAAEGVADRGAAARLAADGVAQEAPAVGGVLADHRLEDDGPRIGGDGRAGRDLDLLEVRAPRQVVEIGALEVGRELLRILELRLDARRDVHPRDEEAVVRVEGLLRAAASGGEDAGGDE